MRSLGRPSPSCSDCCETSRTGKLDYVIVHKIDRLARNREDDIAINVALQKAGVRLVSCTENIDDTPTGLLLYGLMAEMAQFYSHNLARRSREGDGQKAKRAARRPGPHRLSATFSSPTTDKTCARVPSTPSGHHLVQWCFEHVRHR